MKSFIYGHIHPCWWIKITLSFKLQAQNSKLKLYTHEQAILPTYESWGTYLLEVFKFPSFAP
jgi:hypothetical protein